MSYSSEVYSTVTFMVLKNLIQKLFCSTEIVYSKVSVVRLQGDIPSRKLAFSPSLRGHSVSGTTFVYCIKDGDSKYQKSLSNIYLFMEEIHSAK